MSTITSQATTETKNVFFRDSYRRAIKCIIFLSVLAVVLASILIGLIITTPRSKYYATTTAGQVIPMHSLSEPVITNSYLLQWASLATRTAFNLDFVHYKDQLNRAESDFTPDGWKKFLSALEESSLLKTVIDKKLQMSAIVSGTPVIVSTGVIHGRFTWRLQLPILITFTSANQTSKLKWMVTMNVQRISTLDAYKGIQISDFIARGYAS